MARKNYREIQRERERLYRQLDILERDESEVTGSQGAVAMGWLSLIASFFIWGIPIIGIPLAIFAFILGLGTILSKPKLEEAEEPMYTELDKGEGVSPNNLWVLVKVLFWGFVIISAIAAIAGTGMFASIAAGAGQ